MPISRLARHIPRFWIDDLDRLCPLRMVDFRLCRLFPLPSELQNLKKKTTHLGDRMHEMDQSLSKGDFEPEPMGIIETLSECLHKLCAVFEGFRWPYLHSLSI